MNILMRCRFIHAGSTQGVMSAVTGIVLVNFLFFVRFVSPLKVSPLRLAGSSGLVID